VDGEWYDGRDPAIGCPQDYADVLIAERFGGWPWSLKDAPADDYYRFMRLMGLEAEIKGALMGLEPDEEFIREDE
jgi:hypothetical protein